MAALCGKWNQASSDNYGALLDALGVPADTKEVFLANKASLEISQDGDSWTLKSVVMGKTREDKVQSGVERDGTSLLGQPVKITVTVDGDTMTEVSKSDKGEMTTKRAVEGGQLVSTYTLGSVTATIKFDKA